MRTIKQAAQHAIVKWEGGFQAMPEDLGNYIEGRLVGTNRGVTPKTWATFSKMPAREITRQVMYGITLEQAVDVYLWGYWDVPNLDLMPFGPAIEVASDIGWGSGPGVGVKALQAILSLVLDGVVGPRTIEGYRIANDHGTHLLMVNALKAWRLNWYDYCVMKHPPNKKFIVGWRSRANYYAATPANYWWSHEWFELPGKTTVSVPTPKPVAPREPPPARGWWQETLDVLQGDELISIFDAAAMTLRMMPGLAFLAELLDKDGR